MQGRLQGKRFHARYFLDEVVPHATEACAYLLAVDTEMNTVDGYELTSWESGYGDFVLVPDLATLRVTSWQPGTALVIADVEALDGSPVRSSPRQILRAQLAKLDRARLDGAGRHRAGVHCLRGRLRAGLGSGLPRPDPGQPLQRRLLGARHRADRAAAARHQELDGDAGLYVESAKGECNLGQHEIAFRYADALTTADQHSIYKTGAKEIAAHHGYALTFMAKPNAAEGNSCHIHLSFRATADGAPVMAGKGPHGLSPAGESIIAGMLAGLRELTLLFAPTINSYKRYAAGSFAPTSVAWGPDNRTCALRLVGHGPSLRIECRVPGGDVNPYLALAGLIAAAAHGVENSLELPPPVTGNAYAMDELERVPASLDEALALWVSSPLAQAAFGADVVDHYANMARVEIAAYAAAVTDWELRRYFERI